MNSVIVLGTSAAARAPRQRLSAPALLAAEPVTVGGGNSTAVQVARHRGTRRLPAVAASGRSAAPASARSPLRRGRSRRFSRLALAAG